MGGTGAMAGFAVLGLLIIARILAEHFRVDCMCPVHCLLLVAGGAGFLSDEASVVGLRRNGSNLRGIRGLGLDLGKPVPGLRCVTRGRRYRGLFGQSCHIWVCSVQGSDICVDTQHGRLIDLTRVDPRHFGTEGRRIR